MNGSALDKHNWEILRMNETEDPFSIENSVENYEKNCESNTDTYEIAKIIVNHILETGREKNKLVSLGVGKGIIEYLIKKLCPELFVECTDYTAAALDKLKRVSVHMDSIHTFDMLNDSYTSLDKQSTILMFRVSTEFDMNQWNMIFNKMYCDEIENIIFVPTELATYKDAIRERKSYLKNLLRNRKNTFCGWLYSEDEFLKMFKGNNASPLYDIEKRIPYHHTAIFILKRHQPNHV
jgi:hypothetical protein